MSLLEVSEVSRSFGGNRAVDEVSFEMAVNTLAIVGPNGAGKSTLLNLLAGQLHPNREELHHGPFATQPEAEADARELKQKNRVVHRVAERSGQWFVDYRGSIRFRGQEISRWPPWKVARVGMVKTYQIVRPFRSLTVEENLYLFARLRGAANLDEILLETGLEEVRRYPAGSLPFGFLKRLELAKGLATRPDLLLLDEPIGGLSRFEAAGLLGTLANLKAKGVRMVIVEHRLSEILPIVDRVIALDRGRIIFHGSRDEFYHDPAVRTAYLGSSDAAG
ncbi:MAG TPA: ATP-binding cassette domain-containing protein [Thermoplasmata archaeon]|nr:ATP-binding cassette domain-containing protein [Thermoplasmata archaeon]